MKIKELRTKSPQELQNLLKELREKLRDLRFQIASKKLKKVREIRIVKKTIARVLTLLNQNTKSKERV
jgi:large subunit ribosomal protein L29